MDYVPGKTDLYSLPKDVLIMLLTQIERDTVQHYKNNDLELEELRFRKSCCECEYSFVRCNFPECKAMALMHGKYSNEYEWCEKMLECDCGKTFCDRHFSCSSCQKCESCMKHQKCKYCDLNLCPSKLNNHLPPIKYENGVCECGKRLEKQTGLICYKCIRENQVKTGLNEYINTQCDVCHKQKNTKTFNFYKCVFCEKEKVAPQCERCGLQRHFGCKLSSCPSCREDLCPECVANCQNCNIRICVFCYEDNPLCLKCSGDEEKGEEVDDSNQEGENIKFIQ